MRPIINLEVAFNISNDTCTIRNVSLHILLTHILQQVLFLLYILKNYETTVKEKLVHSSSTSFEENPILMSQVNERTNTRLLAETTEHKNKPHVETNYLQTKTEDSNLFTLPKPPLEIYKECKQLIREINHSVFLDIYQLDKCKSRVKKNKKILKQYAPHFLKKINDDEISMELPRYLKFYETGFDRAAKMKKLLYALEYYMFILQKYRGVHYNDRRLYHYRYINEYQLNPNLRRLYKSQLSSTIKKRLKFLGEIFESNEHYNFHEVFHEEYRTLRLANCMCREYINILNRRNEVTAEIKNRLYNIERKLSQNVAQFFEAFQ